MVTDCLIAIQKEQGLKTNKHTNNSNPLAKHKRNIRRRSWKGRKRGSEKQRRRKKVSVCEREKERERVVRIFHLLFLPIRFFLMSEIQYISAIIFFDTNHIRSL